MKYWMSLEQWKKDKTFQKLADSEFVTPPFAPEDGSWDRREFLKLMGASLALSSLGCLRRPAEKIIPHIERPEDQVPGLSNYYASSYYDGGEAFGLIVQTREGRAHQSRRASRTSHQSRGDVCSSSLSFAGFV